jgi:hypothetical protein
MASKQIPKVLLAFAEIQRGSATPKRPVTLLAMPSLETFFESIAFREKGFLSL